VIADYGTWPHRRAIYASMPVHAVADFPIFNREVCLGVLALARDKPGHLFTPEQITFGSLFAQLAALILDNAQLRENLHQQAIRDPLTGLFNRRYLEATLVRETLRATRNQQPLGIIMLDIDHFKRINDSFGHAAGDLLLSELARFLQRQIRGEDIACRYGGEEFTLILPNASLEVTHQRAERLRAEVQHLRLEFDRHPLGPVTLSLGVAVFPQPGLSIDAIVHAADEAMYAAKRAGRNRVCVATYG
jgi:diguanylate cyclase (GGDEF)-like protein